MFCFSREPNIQAISLGLKLSAFKKYILLCFFTLNLLMKYTFKEGHAVLRNLVGVNLI